MPKKFEMRSRVVLAAVSLLVAFLAITTATFAWYIYNTSAHTTKMEMAAGSSTSLEINDQYAETDSHKYKSKTSLPSQTGVLNPVSTNKIGNGFHKVYGFTNGSDSQGSLQANLFGSVDNYDYYEASLYFRSAAETALDLYVSDITFVDGSEQNPLSTAMRVGFVVHPAGTDSSSYDGCTEYIFALNEAKNIQAPSYNTKGGSSTGEWALDSTHFSDDSGGSSPDIKEIPVVEMLPYSGTAADNTLYTSANYLEGDEPVSLCVVGPSKDSPVRIDVYLWLEGCDKDCTNDVAGGNLDSIAFEFVGIDHA